MSYGEKKCLIFFALETSGYEETCDILQIFLKCGSATFNEYIEPTQMIPTAITKVNHLTNKNGKLYRNGEFKRSRPLNVVLERVLHWLEELKTPCILIAHRSFHYDRLLKAIKESPFKTKFRSIIHSFTNTWNMFKTKFPDYDNSKLKIPNLAAKKGLRWSRPNGRSIKVDTILLEKLVAIHFTQEELKARSKLTTFI